MSRFKHIPQPNQFPGSCLTCGRPTDEHGFVDTGCEVDGYGAIQLCYRCIQALQAVFGFDAIARSIINEDAVANVHHLHEVVKTMKEQHEAQLDALIGHVAGLDRSFVQSHKLLVQAAGARERIIEEAAERAHESIGLGELGLDSN